MQSSRRAFLFGRQRPRTSWEAFLQRLTRVVQGPVRNVGGETANRARLLPVHREDVRQARALCAEYGIVLRLTEPVDAGRAVDATGVRLADATALEEAIVEKQDSSTSSQSDVLEVDPSRLDTLTHDPERGQWLAQPGCLVGELVRSGLPQFRDAPPEWTLAAWLAASHAWPSGATAMSGVLGVEVLLADGTTEQLGPFGAADVQPLRSATVQRLVPALFQMASSPDATVCRETRQWPCRYRLDALLPAEPAVVNLAHLLLGHGGSLAWVERVTLTSVASLVPQVDTHEAVDGSAAQSPGAIAGIAPNPPASLVDAPPSGEVRSAARRLQIRIKNAFDPMDLYAG